jgi:thioesterase domain-containing protein
LADHVDEQLPIYAIPWPSLDDHSTIETMAKVMAAAVIEIQPDGPYRLIGYSSGGMLAYAIADHLHRLGKRLSFIGLIDTWLPRAGQSPQPIAKDPPSPQERLTELLLMVSEDELRRACPQPLETLSLKSLIRIAQELQIIEPNITEDLWIKRSKFLHLLYTYEVPPIDAGVHQFNATIRGTTALEKTQAARRPSPTDSSYLGWDTVLPMESITQILAPGDHFSMVTDDQNREELARLISQAVDGA